MRLPLRLIVLFAVATNVEAVAQRLLVCRHAPARIESYDAADGTLLDAAFIDVDALLGLNGATTPVWDVVQAPNGEYWVSNFSAETVHRFSADGDAYLGDVAISVGSISGLHFDGDVLWLVVPFDPGGLYRFDTASTEVTRVYAQGGLWDIASYAGLLLVSTISGSVQSINPITGFNTPWAAPWGLCEQIAELPNGEVLVANFALQGFTRHSGNGTVLERSTMLGAGMVRGIAPLGNGKLMLSSTTGLFLYDPVTGTSTSLDSGAGAYILSEPGARSIGTNYCTATPNSTGAPGSIAAFGSTDPFANDVTLRGSGMPIGEFGIFVASATQDLVPNVGSGNLCLGGVLGRYQAPGQILQIDANGEFSIPVDTTRVPQGAGFVAIAPGETWNFQAWHRDSNTVPPIANTSNFTDAVAIDFE